MRLDSEPADGKYFLQQAPDHPCIPGSNTCYDPVQIEKISRSPIV
jgi:hypothetical protein